MLGAAEQWFYEGLAGIKYAHDDVNARKLWIKPYYPEDMNWLKASHQTVCGKVQVSWKRNQNAIDLEIVIPPNMTAGVMLPDQTAWKDYGSGIWNFHITV